MVDAQEWAEQQDREQGQNLPGAGIDGRMPKEVHNMVSVINDHLNNVSKTVSYVERKDVEVSSVASLVSLTEKMK